MAGVWLPFKELASVISSAILHKKPGTYYTLEAILKKHKPDFISLLQNPAKNATHRSDVRKAVRDGIKTPSLPSLHTLSQDFVDEALILSDILNLNELSAVELLLAGEQQQSRFPGLTRGLVAVLLYHDGRRSIVSTLRSLVQAREGVSWTLGLSGPVVSLVTSFTDQLFADGLVDKILSLLDKIDVEQELDSLSKGRAVGDPGHRQQLVELIQEQRTCLADCLFYWACQNPFPKEATLKIFHHLKKLQLTDGDSSSTAPSGLVAPPSSSSSPGVPKPLDPVALSLFQTLLACFNIGDISAEGNLDDSMVDEHYPLVVDATFVPTLHSEVLKESDWACPSLHAAVKFAWAVLLRECASRVTFSGVVELEEDEDLVDQAVAADAFYFLRRSIVASPHFHQEEYYVRRIYWLLTSFIVNMSLKVKELRSHGDEVAREMMVRMVEGGEVPRSQRRDFEEFMRLVGDLLSKDPCDLNLSLEFWSPVETNGGGGPGRIQRRAPQRQLSLFNFIRLCSDLLPALLFSPFMHMLSGLCNSVKTAHHGFSFLKANSPSLGGGGASAAISLDHFFHSLKQYYLGLRQEGAAKATPTGCAVTPQELEGLQTMLGLIRTIANLDESARVVMYENQTWLPVASLFGLIGCSIPRSLKAEILLTLAAFARSPEIAGSMWHTLEIAQVLNTVPSASSLPGGLSFSQPAAQEGSIQVELEEMESQAEEYPLTRAFLSLLDTLTEVPIPVTLGAGHRAPGFQPYLEFVRDLVFLRFDSRAYRHPEEKWQVAALSLEVLYKLLSSHEISPDDFTDHSYELPGGGVAMVPKPSGHSLLVHMMNDSQLLRKLLSLLDEGSRHLSDTTIPPSEPLAHACLLALKMVESSLSRQEEFMDALRQRGQPVMVTPLHQLLLGINPRTGRADNLVNVARYVAISGHSPELALMAVRVLYWVSKFPKAAKELVTAITSDKDASVKVLHGFVEHLEWEDTETQVASMSDSTLTTVAGVHRAVQLNILKLLSLGVDKPSPNVTHYLLGFETVAGKHISETALQDPGVLGSPRTCLHSVLSLVNHGPDPSNPIGCHFSNPKLAELCYKLLCQMCANRDLSTPTLRYLRNNHDFFFVQLTELPLTMRTFQHVNKEELEVEDVISLQVALLHQQAWLLKSIAVELRMTSLSHQRSHAQRITSILLSEQASCVTDPAQLASGIASELQVRPDSDFFQEGHRKILVLLDMVDFSDKPLPLLEIQFFNHSAMEQAIRLCERQDETSGLQYTDVKLLHKLLTNELNALQGAAATGQRQSVLEEIHEILEVVVSRNCVRENVHACCVLFEAWRQLVEMTLHSLGEEGVRREVKMALLFELIQDLLLKVEKSESSALATSVHSVVLILVAHLRQTVANANTEQNDALLSALYSGPLHGIMRGLMENIMKAPAGMQNVRAYLYGALLYYLLLTKQEGGDGKKEATSLWQPDSEQNSVDAGNLSLLGSFGEPFMETVCRDACSGHDVARMLALALLDAILALDWQGTWLRFMSARGYLQTICASIQWEDEALQKMLLPLPEALRTLYIYESKMAFLTRIAHNPIGARELISLNSLVYLSECHFIDRRPDYHGNGHALAPPASLHSTAAGFVPTVSTRYRQLFFPMLKFLLALLTCTGPQQKEACGQVTTLIGAHSDVFVAVLKEQQSHISIATLQELALVTAVIGHSKVGQDWSSERTTPLVSGLIRIQRLMLTLLPHFWSKQSWHALVQLAGSEEERETQDTLLLEEASLLVQQISANIVAYCRVAMTMGGTEFSSPYSRILLTPDLSEAISSTKDKEPFAPSLPPSQSPSLGLLIRHLRECTEGYSTILESYQQYSTKLDSTGNLSTEEMRQLLPPSFNSDKVSPTQQQLLARRRLKQLVSHKRQELQHHTYIIENLLYILWRHLQFYLVHCRPVDVDSSLGVAGIGRTAMRRMQDYPYLSHHTDATYDLSTLSEGVKMSDLEQLKKDAVKCLADSLFKKLLDMEEVQHQTKAEMRVGFVQALVRRVRRLLRLKAATRPLL